MSSSVDPAGPDTAGDPPTASSDAPGGAVFWVGAVVGIGIMAFGFRGLFAYASATQPTEFAKWFVGADLVHDFVVAPAVAVVGALLARLLTRPWRFPIQAGTMATAIVLAVGWAPLRGYGRTTAVGNATVQPLDYSTAVATVVGVVWLLVGGWLAVIALRRRRERPSGHVVARDRNLMP